MYFKNFGPNDSITESFDSANNAVTISTSADASTNGVWAMVLNANSTAYLKDIDSGYSSATTIPISSAFRNVATLLYNTSTTIPDYANTNATNTVVRAIQIKRANLYDGLYAGSITAKINWSNGLSSLTSVDIVDSNSYNSALGLSGKMVNISNTADTWGGVFYDYGVIVFSMGQGNTGSQIFAASSSGFEFGVASASTTRVTSFTYRTHTLTKRSIFFVRAYNNEFNYTYNPTARQTNGRILDSLSSNPATFVTTVGLYNDSNDLLAIAKISPSKKKSFNNELLFRIQLDF
jgi:hypothetical protein